MPNEKSFVDKPFVEEARHHEFLVYPPEMAKIVHGDLFDVEYLRQHDMLRGEAKGRGVAHFFEHAGGQYILRHYYRGGLVARLSDDQYIWRGLENTRAYRELQIMRELMQQNLPMAEPLAARVIRRGAIYRADIITTAIDGTSTLVACLCEQALDSERWEKIGAVIARFHRAGVYHDDLNAHNILLNRQQQIFVIDFDKARIMRGRRSKWRWDNLARLRRSLDKEKSLDSTLQYSDDCWQLLEQGYKQAWSQKGNDND